MTLVDKKVSTQVSTSNDKKYPKTDSRYWLSSIYRNSRTRNGVRSQDLHYSVRIRYGGRREIFALSPNKHESSAQARDIFFSLSRDGWEATLEKYKPGKTMATPLPDDLESEAIKTVGEFIRAAMELSRANSRSKTDYARAFRRIVAQSFGIEGDDSKYDYVNGGRNAWVDRIDAIPLARVTPARVQQWKLDFLKRAGMTAAEQRTAKNAVNSTLRNAKALFAKSALPFLNLDLPCLPFEGIQMEARQDMRYRSQIEVGQIIQLAQHGDAKRGIAALSREPWKIFLLAIMVGLRRREIDLLEWMSFRYEEHVIRVQPTKFFTAKCEKSYGDVEVDPQVMALFGEYQHESTGSFVIESRTQPAINPTYSAYRCNRHFEELIGWLRGAGVNTREPIHTLRKEFGSEVNKNHDIYAAQRQLRHADIALTSAVYVAPKKRTTAQLGHFLATD